MNNKPMIIIKYKTCLLYIDNTFLFFNVLHIKIANIIKKIVKKYLNTFNGINKVKESIAKREKTNKYSRFFSLFIGTQKLYIIQI